MTCKPSIHTIAGAFLAAACLLCPMAMAGPAPQVEAAPQDGSKTGAPPSMALQWILQRTTGPVDAGQESDLTTDGFMTLMSADRMSLIEGPSERLYDFERRRLVLLDQEKKEWVNTSLYSDIAYRERRLANLEFLRESLSAEDSEGAKLPTPLDAEVVFGIPGATPVRPSVEEIDRDSEISWTLAGRESVSMRSSGDPIPPEMRRPFERWLAYNTQIHPLIRDRIVARGERPLWLRFRYALGSQPMVQTLQWEVSRLVPTNWGRHFEGLSPATLDDSASAVAAHRVTAGELRQPPAPETFQAVSDQALEREDRLGAMLAQLAGLVSTGQENSEQMRKIAVLSSPEELVLQEAVKLQVSDPERSLDLLNSLDPGDREYAYVVDVFRGDAYLALNQPEPALDRFDRALEKDPYLVGAYVDLAAFHFRGFRTAYAWLYWDAARRLRPEHPIVAEAGKLEASLVERFPAFF